MNANKTKLVIFDFDGTLTKPDRLDNAWARIWDKIGLYQQAETLYKMYVAKKINYKEWLDKVLDIFRENKVGNKMFASVTRKIKLLDNCEKVFKIFYQNNIKICVLSNGIKNIIDQKLKSMKKYITHVEAITLTVDNNGVVNGSIMPSTNVEGKSDFILKQMEKYNLKKEEVVFVGNSFNDEDAAKSGVETVCLNPLHTNFKDKSIWTHAVEKTDDLMSILSFIRF